MPDQIYMEISSDNGNRNSISYASLKLPASEYEIQDAFDKLLKFDRDKTLLSFDIYNCPVFPELTEVRLDSTTVEELNFLAQRFDQMSDEEKLAFKAIVPTIIPKMDEDEIVSLKDIINCTYGLENIMVISNVSNESELGQFVIDEGLNEDINEIPEASLYLLDRQQIGKLQKESDSGVFVDGCYVFTADYTFKERYDGTNLPTLKAETPYIFRVKIAPKISENTDLQSDNSQWISLPMDKDKENEIKNALNIESLNECVCLDFKSVLPHRIDDFWKDMSNFETINNLAFLVSKMSDDDRVVFKAAMSTDSHKTLSDIMNIALNVKEYTLIKVSSYAEFFGEYLSYHLDTRFDKEWLDYLFVNNNKAEELVQRLGGEMTPYGVISEQGKSLYDLIPLNDESVNNDEALGGVNLC